MGCGRTRRTSLATGLVVLWRAIFQSFGIAFKRPLYTVNGNSIRYFSFNRAKDKKIKIGIKQVLNIGVAFCEPVTYKDWPTIETNAAIVPDYSISYGFLFIVV